MEQNPRSRSRAQTYSLNLDELLNLVRSIGSQVRCICRDMGDLLFECHTGEQHLKGH
jgi:hypothetical protein